MMAPTSTRHSVFLAAALSVIVFFVYWPVRTHDFVLLDDPVYLTSNPQVQAGLSIDGIVWAFTTTTSANYHPLVWLVHMAAWDCFGGNPAGHHLLNVAIHAISSGLLLFILFNWTGSLWRSAVVAALFALHPLRVESVAWASEVKDTLSTCFLMLTLLAWTAYVRRPGRIRYWITAALYLLGLLSKSMLVTVPLLLLLLDVWPFARFGDRFPPPRAMVIRLLMEKMPFALLAGACSMATLLAQSHGGAVVAIQSLSLGARFSNAVVSCALYLRDTFWPNALAMGYPIPALLGRPIDWPMVAASAMLLVVTTTVVFIAARRGKPAVAVGGLWFLVSLLPVIGIVQVGAAARADRYTYIPHIGLLIMIVWSVPANLFNGRIARGVTALAVGVLIIALSWTTRTQLSYWQNQFTLSDHAIQLDPDNYLAHLMRADVFAMAGQNAMAVLDDQAAVKPMSFSAPAHLALAESFDANGQTLEALTEFQTALRLDPHILDSNPALQQRYEMALAKAGESRTSDPPTTSQPTGNRAR